MRNRAPYEGPLPKEGVSGLPGTKVEVFLRSNRPLSGGTMALWRNNPGTASAAGMPAPQADRTALSMRPTESGSQEAVGQFTVAGDGKFECRVIDEDGQTSQQSFSGNITMLHDERPFLRLLQPPKTSLATPSATLPVVLSAEDDCGISRLQLFRSLNDSRPLPADLPVPSRSPRRLDESVRLPLAEYGLQPGDVIKLFGRVEDNDPAGAKGAESSVATVRIVSQEDFERMFRARQGMQAMLSKYYEARRRMESLAKQIDELSQKLEKLPPGGTASEEMRRELERLRESMRLEAGEIRKAAAHPLPYDLDKYLTPQLTRLAEMSEGMAEELGTLLEERGVLNEKLHGKLDELAKRLSGGRQQFKERAAKPIEYFEAVFPLLADQERFIMLAQWQQDFAQRLASLKGRDGEDNPALKARIRELEQEQRQIHESLTKLLEDIEDHSEKLPDRPELAELRRTAKEFVEAVLASGALEAMAAAEASLAEFAPTPAHKKGPRGRRTPRQAHRTLQGHGGFRRRRRWSFSPV